MKHNWGFKIIMALMAGLAFLFGLSYVVMVLWNGVIPDLFDIDAYLTLYQAMGLLILSKILFHFPFFGSGGCCSSGPCRKSQWKKSFYHKWNKAQKQCEEDDMPS